MVVFAFLLCCCGYFTIVLTLLVYNSWVLILRLFLLFAISFMFNCVFLCFVVLFVGGCLCCFDFVCLDLFVGLLGFTFVLLFCCFGICDCISLKLFLVRCCLF